MSRIISKPFECPLVPAIILDSSVRVSVSDTSSQPFAQKAKPKAKEFVYVRPKDSGEPPAFRPMITAQPPLIPKVNLSD